MKISGIDELDIGMSNISIEGKVTYALVPRHVEGDNDRGHYDFWSQFVVIDDGTGKIGCNVAIEKEEYKLEKGVMARVKGKLDEYEDKKGEMQKSIKGSLVGISKGGKETDVQLEVAKEFFDDKAKESAGRQIIEKPEKNVWEEKDLRIARECAIKAVTELVCAKIMKSKDFFSFADTMVKYIYNGIQESEKKKAEPDKKHTKAESMKKLHKVMNESKSVEVKDKDEPFPDEPTKEELDAVEKAVNEKDEPGSSYDNAIPYKGKKKESSKYDMPVNEEDIPF